MLHRGVEGAPPNATQLPPPPTPDEVRFAVAKHLRMIRELHDENMTRVADKFGVLTTTWRKWETAQSIPDAGVMIAFCDRYFVTMDWLYRGQLLGLPEELILKLCHAYPELLNRKPAPPGPYALSPLSVPDKPATGYRPRKPRSKKPIG